MTGAEYQRLKRNTNGARSLALRELKRLLKLYKRVLKYAEAQGDGGGKADAERAIRHIEFWMGSLERDVPFLKPGTESSKRLAKSMATMKKREKQVIEGFPEETWEYCEKEDPRPQDETEFFLLAATEYSWIGVGDDLLKVRSARELRDEFLKKGEAAIRRWVKEDPKRKEVEGSLQAAVACFDISRSRFSTMKLALPRVGRIVLEMLRGAGLLRQDRPEGWESIRVIVLFRYDSKGAIDHRAIRILSRSFDSETREYGFNEVCRKTFARPI